MATLALGLLLGVAGTALAMRAKQAPAVAPASSSHDMAAMDGMRMTGSDGLAKLTGDRFDDAFTKEMIAHHEGAVSMARAALTNAKHDEIRVLAADIITAQQREIGMMRGWLKSWGYAE